MMASLHKVISDLVQTMRLQQNQRGPTATQIRYAQVSGQNPGPPATVSIVWARSQTEIPGVRYHQSYTPQVANPPAAPTVTPEGTTGSTTYWYAVTSVTSLGESTPSPVTEITNGYATLSTSNYNQISWAAATGAQSYRVYRSADGVSYELIGSPSTTSLSDTGLAGSAATLPTVNTSGDVVVIAQSGSDLFVIGTRA